jgi:hypothetical protein
MKVKELMEQLKNIDPEKIVKLSAPMWDFNVDGEIGKLFGLSHSDIENLCDVEDELWLLDDISAEWLENLPNEEEEQCQPHQ